MEILEQKELKSLLTDHQGPSVSIFMPTYQMGREVRQNPIRLKNLLSLAEERLEDLGLRSAESRAMLEPAEGLMEDPEFWKYQQESLALFLSNDLFRYCRVPFELDELVAVNEHRFHIKPVLPLLAEGTDYYVLTLSQNQVRLVKCSKFNARELDLEKTSIPRSIEQALWSDDPEQQLQFRSGASVPPSPEGGRWESVFHGHGTDDQGRVKEDLRRYFLQIDNGVREVIGRGGAPLVLAGVDYLLPMYAETNKYQDLMEQGITGNPDQLRIEEIHQKSWPIVEPRFLEDREGSASSYPEMSSKGLASSDIKEILPVAHMGRVGTLFAAIGVQVWGAFNADTGQIQTHNEPEDGDQDLVDLAAFLTLTNSGTVFAVSPEEMPDDQPLAAIFRY